MKSYILVPKMASPCLLAFLLFLSVIISCVSSEKDNPIDSCWRGNPNWHKNRKKLADCAVGFGRSAMGGKGGSIYTVTSAHDDPVNPAPGTLRYGATRKRPLWIIFARNLNIKLRMPLFVAGHTTIDGRGAQVHIGYGGPCLFIQEVSNVIIHGLHMHDCRNNVDGNVLISESAGVQPVYAQGGDAISVRTSKHVWIDHNTLSKSTDGLVDVTLASTAVTVSNNHFFDHDSVMLLGHSDSYGGDRIMKVTVAFNRFGPNCVQRMPRARSGHIHVANNNYEPWGKYAIGGSSNPTIISEGNRFVAPKESYKKMVTVRAGCNKASNCDSWVWRSVRDVFLNGAHFIESGIKTHKEGAGYRNGEAFKVANGNGVPTLTKHAGALTCVPFKHCL